MSNNAKKIELSIIIPCLNEEKTLASCIKKAAAFLDKHNIAGEVIVADNGSTDGSLDIAVEEKVILVHVPFQGYGSAIQGGINAAHGIYVIMGDADESYDFSSLKPFVDKLRDGYDLVMGNRFQGGIDKGAMPVLHRYLGNPVLSGIGRMFFHSPIGDFHCGLRAFRKESIVKLGLKTTGMEFASEMVVKATLNHLKITEVPTTLRPDGRDRPPHLNSWSDGWRHLRFLLLYSPRWLFLYPGICMAVLGIVLLFALSVKSQRIFGVTFDIHTMVYASALTILGMQAIMFALFAKVFAVTNKLVPYNDKVISYVTKFTLEKGLLIGLVLILAGMMGSVYAILAWKGDSFGSLVPTSMMRVVIPSSTSIITGAQCILASFFLSVLGLVRK